MCSYCNICLAISDILSSKVGNNNGLDIGLLYGSVFLLWNSTLTDILGSVTLDDVLLPQCLW